MASHTMVQSLTHANSATTAALSESRQQHAAELERLAQAQDALVRAAARDAAAARNGRHAQQLLEKDSELQAALGRGRALEADLKVSLHCWARMPVATFFQPRPHQ